MRTLVILLIASVLGVAGDRTQEALAWNHTGMAYQLQGRYDDAERACSKAIRIAEGDPDQWQVLVAATHNLATVFLGSGAPFSRAEQLLRRALDNWLAAWDADAPELGNLLMQLGPTLMEKGRLTEADVYFQQALLKVQGDRAAVAVLQSHLGVLAYRLHDSSAVVSHWLQSITACEGSPEAVRPVFNLGGLYLELGRNTDAEAVLRKAVEAAEALGNDNALMGIVLRNYALALRRNGKKEESRRANESEGISSLPRLHSSRFCSRKITNPQPQHTL